MLLRHVQGRSVTLYKTLYLGSVATNPTPDTATLTITRADGTAVVDGAAAIDEGAGVFSYTLTPVDTALLDRMTVVWTASYGGSAQTFKDMLEIVGDTFFTLAEARQIKPLDNATQFPDAKILTVRTRIEQRMEKILGFACVPRYERQALSSYGNGPIRLRPKTRAIRSITADGVEYTAPELALLSFEHGFLYRTSSSFPAGWGNVIVGYEHGEDTIDEDIKAAALLLAKVWLVSGPVDDRAASFSTVDGGTYGMVIPGRNGSTVGVPDVDAVLEQNRLRAVA